MSSLPRKPYLVALAATFGLVLFYQFGGPIWRPIKARLAGEKTVAEVLGELEPLMAKRYHNLEALTDGEPMSILAFKDEQRLELWKQRETGWEFVRSYPFTGYSGKLGPKLREGDGQIPEGIYKIEYLNPNSSYHLSIKVDYPNSFDRKMAEADGREGLGFDIFIHGSSATIGCIPIGDHGIEDLFYLIAKNGYRNTTAIISPVDFRLGVTPPVVDGIGWEADLYASLAKKLQKYSTVENPTNENANKASILTPDSP
ncbi:L,D-transpeptidase family protein [Haloferula sp.]|uniref:L,D-transpeptidase family protein n=1 Tax=Haloferula sp. TaxID=2497595 RepID=UPI00329B6EEC